jgi:hypothetical protein
MNDNSEYKRSTQKLINKLIDEAENGNDMKILETIVMDEHDLLEKEPMNDEPPKSAIDSNIHMK